MTKYERIRYIMAYINRMKVLGKTIQRFSQMVMKSIARMTDDKDSSGTNEGQKSILVDDTDISNPMQIKHQPDSALLRDNHMEKDSPVFERSIENDIFLSNLEDLNESAGQGTISKETIEQWIAAGILLPDEIRAAEKLIKTIQKQSNNRVRQNPDMGEKPVTG